MSDEKEWFYEVNGSPVGPVSEEEFVRKRLAGEIVASTRVWTNEMDDWQPLTSVASAPAGEGTLAVRTEAGTACDECLKPTPDDELLAYGNLHICSSCKGTFLDKLKQGVRLGTGPWRERKALIFHEGAELPKRCLRCNAPAEHSITKKLSHVSHWLLLLVLFGLPGILIYLIVAVFVRRRATVSVYLCDRHRKRRSFLLTANWIFFSLLLVSMILCSQLMASSEFFTYFALWILGFLASAIIALRIQMFRVQKIENGMVRAGGAGRPFLNSLQEWRYS